MLYLIKLFTCNKRKEGIWQQLKRLRVALLKQQRGKNVRIPLPENQNTARPIRKNRVKHRRNYFLKV